MIEKGGSMNRNDIFAYRLSIAMNEQSINGLSKKIDMSAIDVSRYLRGQQMPTARTLCKICDALHTTPNYLLGYDDDTGRSDKKN